MSLSRSLVRPAPSVFLAVVGTGIAALGAVVSIAFIWGR